MAYKDNCRQRLFELPKLAKKLRDSGDFVALGYTSDLDVVLEWDQQAVDRLFAEHLREAPRFGEGDSVNSLSGLARVAAFLIERGRGGELDIAEPAVCNYLEARFKTAAALGGTCAQAAAALGAAGIGAVVHLSDQSAEVCCQLDYPGIFTIDDAGEKKPAAQAADGRAPQKHFILQYPKDAAVSRGGARRTAPVANRLILDYDALLKQLPLRPAFLRYCEQNAGRIRAYSLSGFNALTDPAVACARLGLLLPHYRAIKAANPNCVLYLESAHYMVAEVGELVYGGLGGAIDLLGLNEEELLAAAARRGLLPDIADPASVTAALEALLGSLRLRGLVLHTKDYALYYGEALRGAELARGLALGNLFSATRARIGRYGTPKDLAESLRLELSPAGIAFAEAAAALPKKENRLCIAVASRYMEHPKYTIGLGDCFVAGMMTSFI